MTDTGVGARKAGAADAPSRGCGESGGKTELLVWNGLVAKAERAAGASGRNDRVRPDEGREARRDRGRV